MGKKTTKKAKKQQTGKTRKTTKGAKGAKGKKATAKCVPLKITTTTKCIATIPCAQLKQLRLIEKPKFPPPKIAFPLFYVLLLVAVIFYSFFCRCSQVRRAPRRGRCD